MSGSLLVVITYLAGASWGPASSLAPLPSLLECTRSRILVAASIQAVARSNTTTSVEVIEDGDDVVVRAGAVGREMARLSCVTVQK